MGIMDRLSRLIRANVHYQLDRAENPEAMLEQILRDMQASLVSARAQTRERPAAARTPRLHRRRRRAPWLTLEARSPETGHHVTDLRS